MESPDAASVDIGICRLWTCRLILWTYFAKEFSKVAGKDIMNNHKEQVKWKVQLEGSAMFFYAFSSLSIFDLLILGPGSVGP